MPEIPWAVIETEWRERRQGAARRAVSSLGDVPVDEVDSLLFASEPPEPEQATEQLRQAFAAAAADPDGELLLALYVYGLCLERWEQSEDYPRIRTVLAALGRVHAARADESGSARARLLSILVSQAQVMDYEMGVEEAMNCSCPVAMSHRDAKVVATLSTTVRELETPPPERGLDELRAVVRADAEANLSYFARIVDVADAVCAFVFRDAPGPLELDTVLKRLDEAERDPALEDDVYASELQAHRASLLALRDGAEQPRLRIDAADLVYHYPFTLDGIEHEEAVEQALGDVVVHALAERAGIRPATARKLVLNDIWDRGDRSEPGYSGATIELPPIRVEPTAYEWLPPDDRDEVLVECSVEVRLSRLGNHYVCVRSSLEDAGLHEVNQALRRGSQAMGAERLTADCRVEPWARFTDYADEVIAAIAAGLGAAPVRNLNATFHVVLAARSISVQHPDGSTAPARLAELREAVGASLLFHPIRHLAGSLEEWARYPPPDVSNLLGNQGYVGDLVAQTENTTVTFMPASPDWLAAEYQEMVEFVGSIPPLFTLWEGQAEERADALETTLEHIEQRIEDNRDPIQQLYLEEKEIRRLESGIRRQLAFLRSPALCRTRGQRRFLDELWDAAGLPALQDELERRLALLARQQERMAAMWQLSDARKQRRQQAAERRRAGYLGIILGVLGVASLAGVLEWINHVFGVDGGSWAWGEVSFFSVVTLVVLVCLMLFGLARDEGEPPA